MYFIVFSLIFLAIFEWYATIVAAEVGSSMWDFNRIYRLKFYSFAGSYTVLAFGIWSGGKYLFLHSMPDFFRCDANSTIQKCLPYNWQSFIADAVPYVLIAGALGFLFIGFANWISFSRRKYAEAKRKIHFQVVLGDTERTLAYVRWIFAGSGLLAVLVSLLPFPEAAVIFAAVAWLDVVRNSARQTGEDSKRRSETFILFVREMTREGVSNSILAGTPDGSTTYIVHLPSNVKRFNYQTGMKIRVRGTEVEDPLKTMGMADR